MATVNAEVRFAPQLTAWFAANPTKVLQDGEIVYCSDGANVGKYVIGDNSTALSGLTFYGGVSSSGLTIGTTTITSGTNTNILYNNNGVLGEYTLTGTGTSVAMGTSPVFTTDITTPLIIGGTAVGSAIQYKGTSGVGTSTVAAHQFLVGSNGGTTAASIYNNGNCNIGNYATPNNLRLFTIGQDTAYGSFGSRIGGTGNFALYNVATPDANNWSFSSDGSSLTSINNPSYVAIRTSNSDRIGVTSTNITFSTSATGSASAYVFTCPASSGTTASTNRPYFQITGATKTWATGSLAAQYFNYFSSNTVAFAGASTATLVASSAFEYSQGGSNSTITTSAAIYVPTLALTNTTTGIGLLVNAPTGGTASNLAAKFAGGSTVTSGAALATTATDGFLYVPSCAGVPTGVPTAQTGTIPIVADSTNNKLYIYSGGAWVALN